MNRRITYPLIILSSILIIYFLVQPLLDQLADTDRISEIEFKLYFFGINSLVTIAVGVIIYIEGKYIGWMQAVSGLLIFNVFLVYKCLESFPKVAIVSNIILMFSGILIFAFGLVSVKKAVFKKGAGIFFIFLGAVYMLRFPMFMDVLYFYSRKYVLDITPADNYYMVTFYLNYFMIFIELIALDSVIRENIAMDRYGVIDKTYKFNEKEKF